MNIDINRIENISRVNILETDRKVANRGEAKALAKKHYDEGISRNFEASYHEDDTSGVWVPENGSLDGTCGWELVD